MAEGDRLRALLEHDPGQALALVQQYQKHLITPHEGGQREVWESDARFQICCCGRRWGKTKIAAKKALRECRKQQQVVWWIANTYNNVRRGYREVLKQIPPGMLSKPAPTPTSNHLILHFKNGTRMEFYSAENPDALAGEGVDYVVIDEAALIRAHVWTQLIRPTLMDRNGRALMISTPRGFNWFYDVWVRGQQDEESEWASWHFPSSTNPHLEPGEIEEAKRTTPLQVFEQEYLAEFTSDAAAVFRATKEASQDELAKPEGHVIIGVDLAKHHDFTVFHGDRMSDGKPCYHDRFNAVSWPTQRRRLHDAVQSLEEQGCTVTVYIDAAGPGDVIFDDLEAEGLDCEPIKTNNTQWKEMAVNLLSADMERGQAFILEEQRHEFDAYMYEMLPSGRMRYTGPDNGHDDEVVAKMLAHWGRMHGGIPDVRLLDMGTGATEALMQHGREGEQIVEGEVVEEIFEEPTQAQLMERAGVWG